MLCLLGGVALASLAGARRTASAYGRSTTSLVLSPGIARLFGVGVGGRVTYAFVKGEESRITSTAATRSPPSRRSRRS